MWPVKPQTNLRRVKSAAIFRQKVNKAEKKFKMPKVGVKEVQIIPRCVCA